MKTPDPIPDSVSARRAIEPGGTSPTTVGPSTPFETYMQEGPQKPAAPGFGNQPNSTTAPGVSPMSLTTPNNVPTGTPTANTLLTQARNMQDSMGQVESQLKTQNLKLKRSQSHLLKNKLQDANGYLRSAGSKLDVENPQADISPGLSPAARFLAMLGDGQDQLVAVQKRIKDLSASEQGLSPADMLYLQGKMGLAQQEIEYSSTLLGKVIQSLTQVLQTQL